MWRNRHGMARRPQQTSEPTSPMRGTRARSLLVFVLAVLQSCAAAEVLVARSAQRDARDLLELPSVRAAAERACSSDEARGHSACALLRSDAEPAVTPADVPSPSSAPAVPDSFCWPSSNVILAILCPARNTQTLYIGHPQM